MAQAWELDWQRLPLEGLVNARELGGYPTADGRRTLWHRLVRADGLDTATAADLEFLRGYGVTAVLDLRGELEATSEPDRLPEGATYLNVPLFEVDITNLAKVRRLQAAGELTIEYFYDLMYENADGVRRALEYVADAPEGCVLFHCSVGKDRTGALAAIIMLLAGCDRYDVLASYTTSRVNLLRNPGFRAEWEHVVATGVTHRHYDSEPRTLGYWLDRVEQEHGGIVPYLASCGVGYETMEAVRRRIVG